MFRKDRKNVGDWFSTPNKFLPLKAQQNLDLADFTEIPKEVELVILGGGGLGRPDFLPYINQLCSKDRHYKVIGWGIGGDSIVKKSLVKEAEYNPENILKYLDKLDVAGTRINLPSETDRLTWVPCASCLSPLFTELRTQNPSLDIGIYEHLRMPLAPLIRKLSAWPQSKGLKLGRLNNRGLDLRRKLLFISQCKTVITNSYHGVYWATLLNKKVICVPSKDGLYSFKHKPTYLASNNLEESIDSAASFPNALYECRKANLDFYFKLLSAYGDL